MADQREHIVEVARHVRLAAPIDEVWESLATAQGLAGWLADEVDLEVVAGASGTLRDAGRSRRVVVTGIDEGAALHFTWWDEQAPAQVSTVVVDLAERDGATEVTVTERLLLGAAVAHVRAAAAHDLHAAASAWDRRLRALVGEPALLAASA